MKKIAIIVVLILTISFAQGCFMFNRQSEENLRRKAINHLAKGEKYEREGRYLSALDEFHKAESLSPRPAIYYHLGHCYLELDDAEQAVGYLRKALAASPDYRQASLDLALAEKKLQKSSPGKTPSPRIIKERKPDAPLQMMEDETSPSLKQPSQQTGAVPLILLPFGNKKKDENLEDEVLPSVDEVNRILFPEFYGSSPPDSDENEQLRRYIDRKKKSTDSYSFHMDKARMYREYKLYNTAVLEYKDALKANPQSFDAVSELSDLYIEMDREERLGDLYSTTENHFTRNARFYLKWGNFLLKQGELREAARKYRKALTISPDYSAALNNLGIIELQRKNYREAAQYFESVLNVDPNFASAHLNLGIVYADHLKKPEEAREHFEAYLKLKGGRSDEVQKWLEQLSL
ncbi:tetratricopeptide repeat protein [Candidatus Sumerlaeota bacterium]|nr:tetratricopeptide repeat protein [Candidatus Sumerlaeota bacterium]